MERIRYMTSKRKGLTSLWWLPMITGLATIGLGVWSFINPAETLQLFALVFAIALCVAGGLNLMFACFSGGAPNWGWALVMSLIEIGCGVWMLCMPTPMMTVAFIYVVGIWILIAAVNSIGEAGMLAAFSPGWAVFMILMLIAAVVFAVIFLTNPIAGGVAVWLWLGISLCAFGVYRIILAIALRRVNRFTRGML